MKVTPSLSVPAALVALYACADGSVPTVAAATCDEAVFGTSPSAVLENDPTFGVTSRITIGLAPGNCTGEGLFQLPRITWTIEPNPDDSVNTTSVFFSPSNVATVQSEAQGDGSTSNIRGIKIDRSVAANATKIGVLIQAPKDGLRSVSVSESGVSPFNVNIIKGFTNLRDLYVDVDELEYSTCYQAQDGSFEAKCPKCDDLYTPEEVKGISSSIVADLSDFNVEDSPFGSISVTVDSNDNLSLTLPEHGENGVPVDFRFYSSSSNIEIKGSFDCAHSNSGLCIFDSTGLLDGCKDCSNKMVIEGSINGYFNVSSEYSGYRKSPLEVEMSVGGCDHLAGRYGLSSMMENVKCSEGNVTVNAEPLPCVSADIGTLECGTDPSWNPKFAEFISCDFCVVPLPDRECNSGLTLGADMIVYLIVPIAATLLAL